MSPEDLKHILLKQRSVSPEEEKNYVTPVYALADPFLFSDMEKAVERIQKAVERGEHIGIYADYDCDGVPGAVILVELFKKLGILDRVHVYIPDRHDEGYGVSSYGLEELSKKNVSLIITVDMGITALKEVDTAQSQGIDVIVTDHHTALETFPKALAVIHPKNSTYPNQEPCGAVVAFHLVRAYMQKHGVFPDGWEKWLLDLAGFATLADMVPLVGENRLIALYGLIVMRKTKRIGLQTLFAKNNIMISACTEQDLTFTLAPRLNAASRMDTPLLAFELLCTDSMVRAKELCERLEEINTERKTLVARIVKEADAALGNRELPEIVVVGNQAWRPAVLGLVATKLQEKHGKSFFVWGEAGDGVLKGSCRMRDDHHAALLFQSLPEHTLIHAGGHQAAGGFAVSKEMVHFLEGHLNDVLKVSTFERQEKNDHELISFAPSLVSVQHLRVVRNFAPFGMGNNEPMFRLENVRVESVKRFGKNKEHIECVLCDEVGKATSYMFFPSEKVISSIDNGNIISCTATLDAGYRGGVRLRLKEVK